MLRRSQRGLRRSRSRGPSPRSRGGSECQWSTAVKVMAISLPAP
jgi:hypothetical protein